MLLQFHIPHQNKANIKSVTEAVKLEDEDSILNGEESLTANV